MSTIRLNEWLRHFEADYLTGYLSAGGSTFKLVVPMSSEDYGRLNRALSAQLAQAGLHVAMVDSATTRVDQFEKVLFSITATTDWTRLFIDLLNGVAGRSGIPVVGRPGPNQTWFDWVVSQNPGIDRAFLNVTVFQGVNQTLAMNLSLSRDFRVALSTAVQRFAIGGADDDIVNVVLSWLRGEHITLTRLRQAGIYAPIRRPNSRAILGSLSRFMPLCGHPGLGVVIDYGRFIRGSARAEGMEYYTRSRVLDGYEVMRQTVDSIGDMRAMVVVAVAPEQILDDSQKGRGMGIYPALKDRLVGDVDDARFANPLAAVVQVEG